MIDVESAVKIAFSQLGTVMPDYVALSPSVGEFERSADESLWNITFRTKNPDADRMASTSYPYRDKVVQLQAGDGELIAVRNPIDN